MPIFFFQAEDGIRDRTVTGVQTCALPISNARTPNTVTHVLGVRAFGTQLLCEQVIGRALRRQSYDLNDEGKLTSNTPTCSAFRSISPPSQWSRRLSRRARPFR